MRFPFSKKGNSRNSNSCLDGQVIIDERAATAIEFAIIAPVFLFMMMGVFDIGQMMYGYTVLNGAMHEAARTSSLEAGDTVEADNRVMEMTNPILPGAEFTFNRVSYTDFNDVGRPESWNDADGDGQCNNNENYVDENRDGVWSADVGLAGNGGAGDVVIYEASIRYDPVFAIPLLADEGTRRTLSATTAVRRNQPFATQNGYGSTVGVCA